MNHRTATAARRLAETIVDDLDALDDIPATLEAIRVELCDLLEICPEHLTDSQICRDDNLDCPPGNHADLGDDTLPRDLETGD